MRPYGILGDMGRSIHGPRRDQPTSHSTTIPDRLGRVQFSVLGRNPSSLFVTLFSDYVALLPTVDQRRGDRAG